MKGIIMRKIFWALLMLIWSQCAWAASENIGNLTNTSDTLSYSDTIDALKLFGVPTYSGTLSNITVVMKTADGDSLRHAQFALYSHNSTTNGPETLIANSNTVASPDIGTSFTNITLAPASGTCNIVAGTQYWIAISSTWSPQWTYQTKTGARWFHKAATYGTFPDFVGTGDYITNYELTGGWFTYTYSTLNATTLNTATAGNQQVALGWDVVSGATGYYVNRGTSTGSYNNITDAGNVTNSISTGLNNGQVYYFTVTAYDGASNATQSNELNATPHLTIHRKLVLE